MQRKRFGIALIVLLFGLTACTLPGNDEANLSVIQTAIASTLEAQKTLAAERDVFDDSTPTPTIVFYPTPDYTATYAATATEPVPCNLAGFVMDVTVPDDTMIGKGQLFTKTWRLQNIGTCAWTPAYQLVFMSGDQMNVSPQSAFTSLVVEPGAMMDVSVQLTAPMIPGEYQGNFMLADSNGSLFSFENKSAFYVKITVPTTLEGHDLTGTPVATETPVGADEMIKTPTAASNGNDSAGMTTVSIPPSLANTMNNDYFNNSMNFGDLTSNDGAIGFAQFNLSQISSGATIESVTLRIPNYTVSGNPFGNLGCMRVYFGYYYPLNEDDYSFDTLGASGRACSAGELAGIPLNPDVLESYLNSGTSAIDIKVMFNELHSNGDSAADLVRTSPGEIRLDVQYRP